MSVRRAVLDRIRHFNKRVTNRITLRAAGRRFSPFAVLNHTGRRSGRRYATPVIAVPAADGFVIPLTYGTKVDWLHNVTAKSGCSIRIGGREYVLTRPRLTGREQALPFFPPLLRAPLRLAGVREFLLLSAEKGDGG